YYITFFLPCKHFVIIDFRKRRWWKLVGEFACFMWCETEPCAIRGKRSEDRTTSFKENREFDNDHRL
ncbi:MAG: hypothetical protein LUC50_00255, partial [Ruminococcus sp.]|nr:hypothetical protein [Ruminococcus sp.]